MVLYLRPFIHMLEAAITKKTSKFEEYMITWSIYVTTLHPTRIYVYKWLVPIGVVSECSAGRGKHNEYAWHVAMVLL